MQVTTKVIGLEAARAKLKGDRLAAAPARRFLTRAAIVVQGRARELAPVDTGRLRGSIAYELDGGAIPLWARVGTNVDYAPYQELGTRRGVRPKRFLRGGLEQSEGRINALLPAFAAELEAEGSR